MFTRNLARSSRLARPTPVTMTRLNAARMSPILRQTRGYAEQGAEGARESDNRAKLAFRVKLRDIPVELYPLGVVVAACVIGASIALTRILMNDPDMLHHRSVGSGELEKNKSTIPTDQH